MPRVLLLLLLLLALPASAQINPDDLLRELTPWDLWQVPGPGIMPLPQGAPPQGAPRQAEPAAGAAAPTAPRQELPTLPERLAQLRLLRADHLARIRALERRQSTPPIDLLLLRERACQAMAGQCRAFAMAVDPVAGCCLGRSCVSVAELDCPDPAWRETHAVAIQQRLAALEAERQRVERRIDALRRDERAYQDALERAESMRAWRR